MELVGQSVASMLTHSDERKQLVGLATVLKEAGAGASSVSTVMPLVVSRFITPANIDKKGHLMGRRIAYQILRTHPVHGATWVSVANAIDRDVQAASAAGVANLVACEVGVMALRTVAAMPHGHIEEYCRSRWETLAACLSTSRNDTLRASIVQLMTSYATPPAGLEPQEHRQLLQRVLQRPRFAEMVRRLVLDQEDTVSVAALQLMAVLQLAPGSAAPPSGPVLLVTPTDLRTVTALGIDSTTIREILDRTARLPLDAQTSVVSGVASLCFIADEEQRPSLLLSLADSILAPMLHCDWSTNALVSATSLMLSLLHQQQGLLISLFPHLSLAADKLVAAARALLSASVNMSVRVPGVVGTGSAAIAAMTSGMSRPAGADDTSAAAVLDGPTHEALFATLRGVLSVVPVEQKVRSVTALAQAAAVAMKDGCEQWVAYESAVGRAAADVSAFDPDQGDKFKFATTAFELIADSVIGALSDMANDPSELTRCIEAAHGVTMSRVQSMAPDAALQRASLSVTDSGLPAGRAVASPVDKTFASLFAAVLRFEEFRSAMLTHVDASCTVPSIASAVVSSALNKVRGAVATLGDVIGAAVPHTFLDEPSTRETLFILWQTSQAFAARLLAHTLDLDTFERFCGARGPQPMHSAHLSLALLSVSDAAGPSGTSPFVQLMLLATEALQRTVAVVRSSQGATTTSDVAKHCGLLCSELDDAVSTLIHTGEVLSTHITEEVEQGGTAAARRRAPLVAALVDASVGYVQFSYVTKHIRSQMHPSGFLGGAVRAVAATILLEGVQYAPSWSSESDNEPASDRIAAIEASLTETETMEADAMQSYVLRMILHAPIFGAGPDPSTPALYASVATLLSRYAFARAFASSAAAEPGKKAALDDSPSPAEFEAQHLLYLVGLLLDMAGSAVNGESETVQSPAASAVASRLLLLVDALSTYRVDQPSAIESQLSADMSRRSALTWAPRFRPSLPKNGSVWSRTLPSRRETFTRTVTAMGDPLAVTIHAVYRDTPDGSASGAGSRSIEVCAVVTSRLDDAVDEVAIELVASAPGVVMRTANGRRRRNRNQAASPASGPLSVLDAFQRDIQASVATDAPLLRASHEPRRSAYLSASAVDDITPSSSANVHHCGGGNFVIAPLPPRGRAVVTTVFDISNPTLSGTNNDSVPWDLDELALLTHNISAAGANGEHLRDATNGAQLPALVGEPRLSCSITLSAFSVGRDGSAIGGSSGGAGGDLFSTARDPSTIDGDDGDDDGHGMDDGVSTHALRRKGAAAITLQTESLSLLPLHVLLRPAGTDGSAALLAHNALVHGTSCRAVTKNVAIAPATKAELQHVCSWVGASPQTATDEDQAALTLVALVAPSDSHVVSFEFEKNKSTATVRCSSLYWAGVVLQRLAVHA